MLSRGLQKLGYESKTVLLAPGFEGDLPGIVRAEPRELESSLWWREQNLDGVIMVAWGRHRDTPVVRAIAGSRTPLVLHVDGSGAGYPFFRNVETLKTLWRAELDNAHGPGSRSVQFLKEAFTQAVKLALRHSYLKYRHLRYATVVTLQTPTSLEGHRRLCSMFGGKAHKVNLQLAGYPISPKCVMNPSIPKEKRIIAIGRWEDIRQKRPGVLMSVCSEIAGRHKDLGVDIFGSTTEALAKWHRSLPSELRERIRVHGKQPGEVVSQAMQTAQISFFPSAYEGGPQALFECLACGATTVALDSPDLPGTRWAADCHHADLAARDTTEAYVEALERGLQKWQRAEYSAQQISALWFERTRAENVLKKMIAAAQAASVHTTVPIA